MQPLRLEKYLADRGVASRRAAARCISDGRVQVNGTTVREPGMRVMPDRAAVTVDGRAVHPVPTARRTIALYKPRGYICSASSAQGRSVLELLPEVRERVVPVGRLDKDSEGLLILTDDGDLALRLTHPRYGHAKRYLATLSGTVDEAALAALASPIAVDGHRTRPARVQLVEQRRDSGKCVVAFTIEEGRNRQVRRLCEAAGLRVHRLVRTDIGPFSLDGLRPGEWRDVPPAGNRPVT
jgi:23S rRNA pseudouridine2605 synthase